MAGYYYPSNSGQKTAYSDFDARIGSHGRSSQRMWDWCDYPGDKGYYQGHGFGGSTGTGGDGGGSDGGDGGSDGGGA